LPESAFRHAIIALTQASGFRNRIRRPDVTVHALNKQPGNSPAIFLRLYRLLKVLHPMIVHTRNLGTIECALIARLGGVAYRIHGEHGWDVHDPDGKSRKYRTLRRLLSSSIDRFVAVSSELEQWLIGTIGLPSSKVVRICNGVDTERFRPAAVSPRVLLPAERFPQGTVVVGSVTRFSAIKDPLNLVSAFILARKDPTGSALRLVMIGDGPLKADAQRMLSEAGEQLHAWLPGSRDDIPELLRELDVFALGSAREGISNTVLEAMASGLPVVASATGGNLELVEDGLSGRLVAPKSSAILADALLGYARDPGMRWAHGCAARVRIEQSYSLKRMMADYEELYLRRCMTTEETA
jgi:sugar transferase (PEP-CTERM/EpsH1 system associated)